MKSNRLNCFSYIVWYISRSSYLLYLLVTLVGLSSVELGVDPGVWGAVSFLLLFAFLVVGVFGGQLSCFLFGYWSVGGIVDCLRKLYGSLPAEHQASLRIHDGESRRLKFKYSNIR
jgi:hypothetical protein